MVNNYFLHNLVHFVLAKGDDGWLSMAKKIMLCAAFFDAGTVDNTEDIKIRRRQSHGDDTRFPAGKNRLS